MNKDWPEYYILLGRTPIAVDMYTWARSYENFEKNKRIAYTDINDKCNVSTVFLGMDHNYRRTGDPILFETMIFGGPLNEETWRYTTYDDAERGHAEAVTQAQIACAQVKAIAVATGADT